MRSASGYLARDLPRRSKDDYAEPSGHLAPLLKYQAIRLQFRAAETNRACEIVKDTLVVAVVSLAVTKTSQKAGEFPSTSVTQLMI